MTKIILPLIWVIVAGLPMLNAQQALPTQTTTIQPTSKSKAAGTRAFSKPRVQPTQGTTPNNNPGRDKRIANNPGHGKPAANSPGHGKPAANSPGNGKP